MHAVTDALAAGVRVSGCTVHLLAHGETDGGPIVLQAAVPVLEDDDADRLRARVHEQEWRLLPQAVTLWCEGRLRREGRRVRILPAPGGEPDMTLRALLGPHDKTGLVEFARGLRECGVELVATDGTRRALASAGIEAAAVSSVTGLPEMLDGRVKTLHPAIHAGILARRDLPDHLAQLAAHGFAPIDLVAVSLYPFRETVARGASRTEVIETIDIGGPTLIRGAAKNANSVAVVVSPEQYPGVLAELRETGAVSDATRRRLAAIAFAHVAAYDTAVAAYLAAGLGEEGMPPELTVGGPRLSELRYGENPHQRGALYAVAGAAGGLARARHLQGPALSFTNWLDANSARRLVGDFDEPAAAVIKHTNPCGFAVGPDIAEAYRRAHACDPRSAYGGVVALNRAVDAATAVEIASTFLEVLVAPGVDPAAAETLARRQRMRVLSVDVPGPPGQARRPQRRGRAAASRPPTPSAATARRCGWRPAGADRRGVGRPRGAPPGSAAT